MSENGKPQKLRGRRTVLPEWWLERANACWRAWKKERGGFKTLAEALTDAYKRTLNGKRFPWDRKTVERFLDDENPTHELMEAFCALFPKELIPCTFVAESPTEAAAYRQLFDGFRATPGNPEQESRRRQLVEEREAIEARVREELRGQSPALESSDDVRTKASPGISNRRRSRSVGRGRSAAS